MKIADIHLTDSALLEAIAENIQSSSGKLECEDYFVPFGKRAESLANEGKSELADAFRFLNFATWFRLNPDDQNRPFEPLFSSGIGGACIDDLTGEQLAVAARVAPTISDPELRARLADLAWVYKRDYELAQVAVSAYTESARRLLAGDFCGHALPRFERALQISAMLGKQQIFQETASVVESIVTDSNTARHIVAVCLDLLLKFGIGDPRGLARLSESRAAGGESKDKPIWRRRFWGLAVRFYERAKLPDEARRAGIEVAKTFEAEAEDALNRRSPPSHLVAMSFLENAIQAYRRVPGTDVNRKNVHQRLLDCQKKAASEIPSVTIGTYDVSEIANHSRDMVRGKLLPEALRTLALAIRVPSKARLREQAEQNVAGSPLAFLFPTTKLGTGGKVVAKPVPGSTASGEGKESLACQEMYEEFSRHRQLVAVGQVEPMRLQILAEHCVRYNDLWPFVAYNRLVPPGRESFFVHGLYDGLNGRLIHALHILVPQLENSIRYMLPDDVITSSLDENGVQQEHDINRLLYEPRLTEVFTEDIIFVLQALLVEKSAVNFRNQLAHGMLEYGAFFSETALYLWWLVLHLCALGEPPATPEAAPDTKSEEGAP